MQKPDISSSRLRKFKNLFESVYLFLLVDQHEDGLWGKSLTSQILRSYSRVEEAQIAETRKRAKSITATFHAVDAIYKFTRDPINPAIERALTCLPNHRDISGGYGTFGELISAYPKPRHQILINCRHSATAPLTYLLFQKIDVKTVESVRFLIDHAKKDGGWSVTPDPEKQDSECLTTSYVLKLLTLLRERRLEEFLSKKYSSRLDKAIENGLDWLKRNNEQNDGFWIFPSKDEAMKKVLYSTVVLEIFSELRNYMRGLYEETLSRVASLQREDAGWPLSLEGRSELESTIWAVSALVRSKKSGYEDQIEKGIDFIVHNASKQPYTSDLITVHWSGLLGLADYMAIHVSHERDCEIRNLASAINSKINEGDIGSVLRVLPRWFRMLEEPLLRMLRNYCPDIEQDRKFVPVQAYPALLKEKVIVLGKYGKPKEESYLNELEEIRDYLRNTKGYHAYLVKDLPEDSSMGPEEKSIFWMTESKFCVMVDREPSGYDLEYKHAKEHGIILAVLRPSGLGSTRMMDDAKIHRVMWVRFFIFENSFKEVINTAIEWAENEISERIRAKKEIQERTTEVDK